jgi:hypothetical protein
LFVVALRRVVVGGFGRTPVGQSRAGQPLAFLVQPERTKQASESGRSIIIIIIIIIIRSSSIE